MPGTGVVTGGGVTVYMGSGSGLASAVYSDGTQGIRKRLMYHFLSCSL